MDLFGLMVVSIIFWFALCLFFILLFIRLINIRTNLILQENEFKLKNQLKWNTGYLITVGGLALVSLYLAIDKTYQLYIS